jgi:glutamate 5-kinase
MSRRFQRPIKRLVIKLGSSQIADASLKVRTSNLSSLVHQISTLRTKGIEVVLVSSGAIALGMGELKDKKRPARLADLQARAAVGQPLLMHAYHELFKKHNLKCAQVLLTQDDFDNRSRYVNAQHTLDAILTQGIVPVINENDTISTEEIKFGDNDKLSALVATSLDADLLVILSDVEGFHDQNKQVLGKVQTEGEEYFRVRAMAGGTDNAQVARGGMITKVDAIYIASAARIPCVIASGSADDVLVRIIGGEEIGTYFVEKEKKTIKNRHWIAFVAKSKGRIVVDNGAKEALISKGKSLLLPGIVRFEGHFKVDDVVTICDEEDKEFARGVINYSVSDLHKIEDKKGKEEVVHRDNLVLSQR